MSISRGAGLKRLHGLAHLKLDISNPKEIKMRIFPLRTICGSEPVLNVIPVRHNSFFMV
jgi:hypothetical protein